MMHSGLVHASLRLPRAGFTPGQDIPFHVHLVNRSQSAFDLKVSLKEVRRRIYEERIICNGSIGSVQPLLVRPRIL